MARPEEVSSTGICICPPRVLEGVKGDGCDGHALGEVHLSYVSSEGGGIVAGRIRSLPRPRTRCGIPTDGGKQLVTGWSSIMAIIGLHEGGGVAVCGRRELAVGPGTMFTASEMMNGKPGKTLRHLRVMGLQFTRWIGAGGDAVDSACDVWTTARVGLFPMMFPSPMRILMS
jgi:hypothetical protein